MTSNPSKIGIVIRTRDSASTLIACLEGIKKQTVQPERILVVDSGSKDETLEQAARFQCDIIHYPITEVPFNYSKAINIGAAQLESDYIAILSSHCVYNDSNALEWMRYFMEHNPSVVGVSLNIATETVGSHLKKLEDITSELVDSSSFRGYALSNAASMIRRDAWLAYAFNEGVPRCEDVDWSYHFFTHQNKYILRLDNVTVQYNNPYGSVKKQLIDIVFISRYYYPPNRSWKNIFNLMKYSLSPRSSRAFSERKFYFLQSWYLMADRLKPLDIPTGRIS
jgi:rhamnosyltransferase